MNQCRDKKYPLQTQLRFAAMGLVFSLGLSSHIHAQEMQMDWPSAMHEQPVLTKLMLDRLEWRDGNNADMAYWEAQAWIGGDINKLWLKTEGSHSQGVTDDADLEAYYSRAVAAFWDAQFGVRHDFAGNGMPARDWLGVGFKGLAPYRFDIDSTAYIGDNGRSALRVKAEYDLLLSQRWVFMPEVEINAYGQDDPERDIGSGLSAASLTLRVRYDIRRELAPYLGVVWTQKYAGTADYARAADEPVSETQYIVGIRAWW